LIKQKNESKFADKQINTYKNEAENKLNESLIDYLDYREELKELKLMKLRESFPGNEFFIE